MRTPRLGVLSSHEGTTLQALIDATQSGALPSPIACVISNNHGSGALRRAQTAGIVRFHLSSQTHPAPAALDSAICDALQRQGVDLVLLLGYMKKLGPLTLERFAGRLLNTHPALLPSFGGQGMYGERVHRAVLASGQVRSGASVHLVEAEYDSGPVIAQTAVPVLPGDTPEALAARVQASERALLVSVLASIRACDLPLVAVPVAPCV